MWETKRITAEGTPDSFISLNWDLSWKASRQEGYVVGDDKF